jgi:hypothetical protein
VRVFIRKIGPNRVRVESNAPEPKAFETKLQAVQGAVMNFGDDGSVLDVDFTRSPPYLDIISDGASWAGTRSSTTVPATNR